MKKKISIILLVAILLTSISLTVYANTRSVSIYSLISANARWVNYSGYAIEPIDYDVLRVDVILWQQLGPNSWTEVTRLVDEQYNSNFAHATDFHFVESGYYYKAMTVRYKEKDGQTSVNSCMSGVIWVP